MDETTTTSASAPSLGDWSDPIEDGVRGRVRAFIEAILEEELEAALGRARYERTDEGPRGWRNGHRGWQVIGDVRARDGARAAGAAGAGGRHEHGMALEGAAPVACA